MGLATAHAEVRNRDGVAVIIGNRTYSHERVPRSPTLPRRGGVQALRARRAGVDPVNVIELVDASQADLESEFGNERNHEGALWSYLNPDGGSDVVVFYSAARGKRDKPGATAFLANLATELVRLERALRSARYRPGRYTTIEVHDRSPASSPRHRSATAWSITPGTCCRYAS